MAKSELPVELPKSAVFFERSPSSGSIFKDWSFSSSSERILAPNFEAKTGIVFTVFTMLLLLFSCLKKFESFDFHLMKTAYNRGNYYRSFGKRI